MYDSFVDKNNTVFYINLVLNKSLLSNSVMVQLSTFKSTSFEYRHFQIIFYAMYKMIDNKKKEDDK